MTTNYSRRTVLFGGCAAAVVAGVGLALPGEAQAAPSDWAPRRTCPHDGCRHWRPGGDGTPGSAGDAPGYCALALTRNVVPTPEMYP